MKILVTGSEGFIGRHLMQELSEHDVAGLDWSGLRNRQRSANDLRQPNVFSDWLHQLQPDVVVHLAAQVGRLFGDQDLVFTLQENAQMTALIAHACGETGTRLCYASTSEVYGDQAHVVCDEYKGPFSLPHNLYGLSKRWGEEVCQLYAPKDLIILRPSMPYGPGVTPGRGRAALPNMLWQAHTRQEIPVHLNSERSWCWIGDTVRAIRLILEKGDGIYNVGRDDDPRSMLAIADKACEMTGAPLSLIKQVIPPKNQTIVKRLSTQRLRDLGWEPEVELDEGMQLVYEWVKQFDEYGELLEPA